jgi:hypothetical protein
MATANVTTFWNALIAALLKCVAALGFAVPSRAPFPAAPRPEATRDGATTVPSSRPSELLPDRDRSLPPTMKQRIRAEAHGASPAARSLLGDIADAGPAVNNAVPAAHTAPEEPIPARRWEWALCA